MIHRFGILHLFFLLFFIAGFSYAQLNSDNWESVPLNVSSVFGEVPLKTEFFSKDTVFILNSAGFFFSADGGNSFSKTQSFGNALSFDFSSRKIGYMVGLNGLLKKTTNSGIFWSDLPTLTSYALRAVSFTEDKKGIVVGDNGTIFRTVDGEVNWKTINSGTTESLWAVKWITDKVVLIGGNNSTMLRSIDGGLNFSPVTLPSIGNIYNLDFYNAQFNFLGDSSRVSLYDQSYILASGSLQTLLRSTDMGITWTNVAPYEPNLAYKKTFS
ncbi:MAG: YCF48-related protein, partial [Ignavibacteria bacterium]|nr:YCF48-related protein [Ignavibacteria bacterium]